MPLISLPTPWGHPYLHLGSKSMSSFSFLPWFQLTIPFLPLQYPFSSPFHYWSYRPKLILCYLILILWKYSAFIKLTYVFLWQTWTESFFHAWYFLVKHCGNEKSGEVLDSLANVLEGNGQITGLEWLHHCMWCSEGTMGMTDSVTDRVMETVGWVHGLLLMERSGNVTFRCSSRSFQGKGWKNKEKRWKLRSSGAFFLGGRSGTARPL